jgi:hypothetical protein
MDVANVSTFRNTTVPQLPPLTRHEKPKRQPAVSAAPDALVKLLARQAVREAFDQAQLWHQPEILAGLHNPATNRLPDPESKMPTVTINPP